jgi:hypothetical protein
MQTHSEKLRSGFAKPDLSTLSVLFDVFPVRNIEAPGNESEHTKEH